jgi:hypothetical protein
MNIVYKNPAIDLGLLNNTCSLNNETIVSEVNQMVSINVETIINTKKEFKHMNKDEILDLLINFCLASV